MRTPRRDGWQADPHDPTPAAPYQLDGLTVQHSVAGWLVDDLAVPVLPPAPRAN